jgi:hypothetical protein
VKIPKDAIIPNAKLTRYLLVLRPRNDKSKFLAQAGFTAANPEALLSALRQLTNDNDASQERTDAYGTYYNVKGVLHGVNNINLNVLTVWLQRKVDQKFQFITLIPSQEENS